MKKPKLLRALDIVPGKFYMALARANSKDITWQPCTVSCTTEPGLERGHVEISFDGPWPKSRVVFLGTRRLPTQSASLFITRSCDNEWVFADSTGTPSLIELNISLLTRALNKVNAELNDLELRKQAIEDILNQVTPCESSD